MTGPEIVERVTRAHYDAIGIFKETWDDIGESIKAHYRQRVTTITTELLDALRDPSEAMIRAEHEYWISQQRRELSPEESFRVMIDALRKEIAG